MNKLSSFILFVALSLCPGTNSNAQTNRKPAIKKVIPQAVFNAYADSLPQAVNLNQDISKFSYSELRLLKNYVYAIHGYWFMKGDLNTYFNNKAMWYFDCCYKCAEKAKYFNYDDGPAKKDVKLNSWVKFSPAESAFVKKVSDRMKELSSVPYAPQNGLNLYKPELIANLFQFYEMPMQLKERSIVEEVNSSISEPFDEDDSSETKVDEYIKEINRRLDEYKNTYKVDNKRFFSLLRKNNFALAHTDNEQIFNIYEQNDYTKMPSYVTPDLYLQAFHMLFDYTLRKVEQHRFVPALERACNALYDESMKIAAKTEKETKLNAEYSASFFAIANKLLVNKNLAVPESYRDLAKIEIYNSTNAVDDISLFQDYTNVKFPYSLFKPRGHYTRNDTLKSYFRGMMWLQKANFCRADVKQFKRAVTMAMAFNNLPVDKQNDIKTTYNAISYLMGEPNNVAILDIADYLKANGYTDINKVMSKKVLSQINKQVVEILKTRKKIKNKINADNCEDKINFMPQRYMFDNEVLQEMADSTLNAPRAFPRGLDVFSALGCTTADSILTNIYKDQDKWNHYTENALRMKAQFGKYNGWNSTMYNKIMESLTVLLDRDAAMPDNMKTSAWKCKDLNTALASWAELKHDAILYAEQPVCAECGDGEELPPPTFVGYIEPNMPFWKKMKESIILLRNTLDKAGLLTDEIKANTETLEGHIDFCIKVVDKELKNEPLEFEEYEQIMKIGSSVEYFTLGLLETNTWASVTGVDKSMAVAVDVFTRNKLNDNRSGILHEATGNANAIYVIVKIGDEFYITRGGTFSYYEFCKPIDTRLTDEEWQKILDTNEAPEQPMWMDEFFIDGEPQSDEKVFYGSGC